MNVVDSQTVRFYLVSLADRDFFKGHTLWQGYYFCVSFSLMCVPEMHNGALTNDMIEQFGMVEVGGVSGRSSVPDQMQPGKI